MTLHMEKTKCVLTVSLRLQPERSPLLLMGLEEVFQSTETKDAASSSPIFVALTPFLCVEPHPVEGEGDRPST